MSPRNAPSRGLHQTDQDRQIQQSEERDGADDRPEHAGILSKPIDLLAARQAPSPWATFREMYQSRPGTQGESHGLVP